MRGRKGERGKGSKYWYWYLLRLCLTALSTSAFRFEWRRRKVPTLLSQDSDYFVWAQSVVDTLWLEVMVGPEFF